MRHGKAIIGIGLCALIFFLFLNAGEVQEEVTWVLRYFNIILEIRYLFSHLLLHLASCFRTYVIY